MKRKRQRLIAYFSFLKQETSEFSTKSIQNEIIGEEKVIQWFNTTSEWLDNQKDPVYVQKCKKDKKECASAQPFNALMKE